MRSVSLASLVFAGACAVACSNSSDQRVPVAQMPVSSVPTTDRQSLVPKRARLVPNDPRRAGDPAIVSQFLSENFGEYSIGPGDPPNERSQSPPPASGAHRKRVARFVHVSDLQLADDESPNKVASTDAPSITDGAFRPQEAHGCRILDAIVQTINQIDTTDPLDLALLGGDNIDSAQGNELSWLLAILGGSTSAVACDSGDRNDPIPGPDNDPKDAFLPAGLDVPWLWVTGNHDVLVQGNYPVTDERIKQATGPTIGGGARDWSQKGGPVVRAVDLPADGARTPLKRSELLARVANHEGKSGPKGHGLDSYATSTARAYFTYDIPKSPIRFLIVDSCAETGGADGVIRRRDLDEFIKPEIARAEKEKKWIVFASHHAADKITDGSGFGGTKQDDAVTQTEWENILTSSPNIVLDLVGHAHAHRIQFLKKTGSDAKSGVGTWEVQTGAIADYPNQFRLIEIWDEDNGQFSIRTAAIDYDTHGDRVADEGRRLATMDFTTGWSCCGGGTSGDRNVVLWRKAP